jgi:small subunit ribosomal protein S16
MATKIRLKKAGRKRQTTFRIVVVDESKPRDGRPIEELGSFNPHTDELLLDNGRANYWLEQGATPSPRAKKLLHWSVEGVPERITKPKLKPKKKVEEVAEEAPAEEVTAEAATAETEVPAPAETVEATEAPVETEAKAEEPAEVEEKPAE